MGSDPAAEHAPDADEAPRYEVHVAAFRLGVTAVTNAQYASFVESTGRQPPCHWAVGGPPRGRERHPVTYVTWDDARAFCRWAGGSLPAEAQWERAARADDARTWPWGDAAPTPQRVCHGEPDTSPVGGRPEGAGPFGQLDLAGNVWEWVSTAYRPYPYRADDGREAASLPSSESSEEARTRARPPGTPAARAGARAIAAVGPPTSASGSRDPPMSSGLRRCQRAPARLLEPDDARRMPRVAPDGEVESLDISWSALTRRRAAAGISARRTSRRSGGIVPVILAPGRPLRAAEPLRGVG